MRIRALLITPLALVVSAAPVVAQEEASPDASASPAPAASVAPSSEPSGAPAADADASASPGPEAPRGPTAKEVYDNLERMAAGKHPKADYKKVVREAKRFLDKHPDAVMPARKLWGNKKATPDNVFKACKKDLASRLDYEYGNCTAAVRMLYWAYLVTRDEQMLDITDRFIGATQDDLHKRYLKVTRDFVWMSFGEQADLFREPVDLPPVTDKEHVAIVLVDPGVLDQRSLVDMLANSKGIDRDEAKALLKQVPITVFDDMTYKDAKGYLPYLMIGTSSWGITDAAAAPGVNVPSVSPAPSEEPVTP